MSYDPLNGYPTAVLSLIQTVAGDCLSAVDSANRAIGQDPTSYLGYRAKIAAEHGLGRLDDALATAKKALELSGGHAWVRAEIATTLALRGDTAHATEVYEALRRFADRTDDSHGWSRSGSRAI